MQPVACYLCPLSFHDKGHAEQWGSVTRKRDKKITQPSQPTSVPARGDREKSSSDFRGGRGGRGGRGRGGGGRGGSRGAHTSGQQREAGTSSSVTNGVATPPVTATNKDGATNVSASPTTSSKEGDAERRVNGVGGGTREARAKATPNDAPSVPAPAEPPVASTSEAGQAGETSADLIPPATQAVGTSAPDVKALALPSQNGRSDTAKAKVQLKTSKVPTGAKLSWAQVAR
jgi:hypothetical protein